MLTPELQQYISQQRAAGVSDDQIRQALVSQGWVESDIGQALGGQARLPAPDAAGYGRQVSAFPQPASQSSSHFPAWAKVLVAAVVVLGLLGSLGAWGWSKIGQKAAESGLEKALEKAFEGNADVDIKNDGKDWSIKTDEGTFSTNSKSMPSGWPSEFPQYPNSTIGTSATYSDNGVPVIAVVLSTQDSPEKVVEFYTGKLKTSGYINIKEESFGGSHVVEGEKDGFVLSVMSNPVSGSTSISLMYRVSGNSDSSGASGQNDSYNSNPAE